MSGGAPSAPAPRSCVFFDRDGVINRSPGEGYVTRVEDFHLNAGLVELLRLVRERGHLAIVITSQRCVGKGLLSEAGLDAIHRAMAARLARHGLAFDAIYAFLGTPATAAWEKPNPDMILAAAAEHGVDLPRSWMIGDHDRDILMARRAGVGKTLRIRGEKPVGVAADFEAGDLAGARAILERHLPA